MTYFPSLHSIDSLCAGDHLCCVYETDQEHRAVLTPFLRQGLERKEKVLYIADTYMAETILAYLRDDGLDLEPHLAQGHLTILTADESYTREGVFDPDGMIALLQAETERALAEGYDALRVSGEMTWALRGFPGSERVIEYETKLNRFFPEHKCLAICQYDRRRFEPATLLDVLRTHPIAIVGTEVYSNFYYTPPDELLAGDPAISKLRRWVHQLAEHKQAGEALAESEARYHSLFEDTPIGLYRSAPDGRLLDVNPALVEMLGYPNQASLLAINMYDLYLDAQERTRWEQPMREHEGLLHDFETQLCRYDGQVIWVSDTAHAVRDRHGRILHYDGAVQDITERRQAEEALRESEETARVLNEELEDRVAERTLALRRQTVELEALVSMSSALRQATASEDVLSVLVEETARALEAETAAVLLLSEDALVVSRVHGLANTLLGQRHLPCDDPFWQVVRTGRPIQFDSIDHKEVAACELAQTLARSMATMAIVPLQAAEEVLGLLLVVFSQPDRSVHDGHRLLTAIAEMGGNALQRATGVEMLERMVRDRTRDLTTLYEVTTTATQHLDIQVILERVLEQALEAIGGGSGLIHLLDADGQGLCLAAQRGIQPGLDGPMEAEALGAGLWGRVLSEGDTVVVPDLSSYRRLLQGVYPQGKTYVGVPIHGGGRILGVLSAFGKVLQEFSAEDVALLAAIADHVGVTVESARLRQREEDAAVMEERQRLARELHDSVTQSLYSVTLFAGAAHDSARAGDLTQVQHYLGRLGEIGQQALKEMRLLIYELQPLTLTQEGLIGALHRRLEAVERHAGMEARLVLETPVDLPARVEAGLYGIAQEALNNVLRHSSATQVTVRIGADDGGLYLEVMDNGKGFELRSVKDKAGIGLVNMQDRAEGLGGSLQITSKPEAGTSVRVFVPWDANHDSNNRRLSL